MKKILSFAAMLSALALNSISVAATDGKKGVLEGSGLEQSAAAKPDPNSEAGWVQAGFGNPKITKMDLYSGDRHRYTHEADLDIVVVRGSGWTKEIIEERYKKVVTIFRQCDLKFSNMRMIEVDAPLDPKTKKEITQFDTGTRTFPSTANFSERIPAVGPRLASIHVRLLKYGGLGFSGAKFAKKGSPRLYKQWISAQILSEKYKVYEDSPSGFCSEAHELGHALLNCRHKPKVTPQLPESDENGFLCDESRPNVMGKYGNTSGDFTPAQCEQIRSNTELVRRIK